MGNAIFIVWRESVEAMLVIGILYTWLSNREQTQAGLRFLWGGVIAGMGLALLLAIIMLKVQSELAGQALEYFQVTMILVASALITQMIFWMRKHGRMLKRELETNLEQALERTNWWGVSILAMIAVGREGAETVIFLYGNYLSRSGEAQVQLYAGIAAGFGLALLTFWILARSSRYFSWKSFFRFSELILLFLAAALLMDSVGRMIGLGWLPPLLNPVWDSSWLLDDSTRLGGLVASLTGYRAYPALLEILVYISYWLLVLTLLKRTGRTSRIQVTPT
jgi:high-affinity iron transporter